MAGVPERIAQPSESIAAATPLPGVSAEQYGAGLGQALEQAGGQLQESRLRAVRAEKQRQEEADNASAAAGSAQLSLSLTRAAQAARDDAPLDGAGHVDKVSADAEALIGNYLGTIKDPQVRARWAAHSAEVRANLIADEDGWARGRRIQSVKTNATEAQKLQNNQLQNDPDPHSFDAALKAADAFWDGAQAPADVKDAGRREWKEGSAFNYAHGLNEKDPNAGLVVLHSGLLDQWLTPEHKTALVNEAQVNIRIADADTRRVLAQQVSQLHQDVTEYQQRVDRGELPSDEETKTLVGRAQTLGETQLVDDVTYSTGKLKMSRVTDKWTPAEWEGHINALAAKVAGGKATAEDQQELRILQDLRGAKETRFRSDPDGYAAASGIAPPQVDLSSPDAGTVNARKSWARSFARTGGLIEPPYLNKDQLQLYRDRANQGPVGQLEVASELRKTWGMDAAPSIVRQIGGEAKASMEIMLGLNDRMAQVYRRGHEALDKKAVKLDEKIIPAIWQQFLPGVPADVAPALLDTARKITAGWMLEQGKTEPTANFAEIFGDAVQRAAGMLGGIKDGVATGGFVNWNGRRAWLPQDMTRPDMQARMSRAAPADWARAAVDLTGNPTKAVPHHLGADGKPKPYKISDALRFGQGTLQTVAPGIYHLIDPMGGTVVDGQGRPWQFDIRRLPRSHVSGR